MTAKISTCDVAGGIPIRPPAVRTAGGHPIHPGADGPRRDS